MLQAGGLRLATDDRIEAEYRDGLTRSKFGIEQVWRRHWLGSILAFVAGGGIIYVTIYLLALSGLSGTANLVAAASSSAARWPPCGKSGPGPVGAPRSGDVDRLRVRRPERTRPTIARRRGSRPPRTPD